MSTGATNDQGSPPSGLYNTELLLVGVQNKLNNQGDKLNQIEATLLGLEERLSSRYDKEKEYLRDRLSESMQLMLTKLANISDAVQEQQQHQQQHPQFTETKSHPVVAEEEGDGKITPQKTKSDLKEKAQTISSDNCDVLDAVAKISGKLKEIQEDSLGGVSAQVATGFDMLREQTISQLQEEKRQLVKDKELLQSLYWNRSPVTETHGAQSQHESGVIVHDQNYKVTNKSKNSLDLSKEELETRIASLQKTLVKEMKTVTTESREIMKNEISEACCYIIGKVHTDMDRQVQCANRDLAEIIEKECQLTREATRWGDTSYSNSSHEFYFRVSQFEERVKSGVEITSCPWYIHYFDTCLKGTVSFSIGGPISIRLIEGRYPKFVGMNPKPKRRFTCEMKAIDIDDPGREKLLEALACTFLDEKSQSIKYASWGPLIGEFSRAELREEGFVKNNTRMIKYSINELMG